ncbi:MAG TPA: hypothetical protein VJB09_01665 [Candidatus Paceibacterota bacterium]
MFKIIFPIIAIIISLTGLFGFVMPGYKELSALKTQVSAYDQALNNSRSLEEERDKLTQKFNSISATDLDKIEKLVPDNVDNIRLILEIEKLASPYGMVLKDVHYEVVSKEDQENKQTPKQGGSTKNANLEYGSWDLEFATEGSYGDFVNFVADLEQNLRIVDVVSVQFSSGSSDNINKTGAQKPYKYKFKIKTYWLKN